MSTGRGGVSSRQSPRSMRAPVGELRTMAEEIAVGDAARIRAELAPALVSRARMVEHLLDDLLLASDLTTELPGGEPEPVDLIATAQAAWDAMETGAELKLEGEHEAVVLLRDGAADQVLNRVLDNARRYGEAPLLPPHRVRRGHDAVHGVVGWTRPRRGSRARPSRCSTAARERSPRRQASVWGCQLPRPGSPARRRHSPRPSPQRRPRRHHRLPSA